jgi:uncharacterized repeat protein (TIGR03803 family)
MKRIYLMFLLLSTLGSISVEAQFTNLYYFGNTDSSGANPNGTLVLSGNRVYGTTEYGGPHGWGTVFSVKTDGTGYEDLFNLSGYNGREPGGSVLMVGKNLYVISRIGMAYGWGGIFCVDTNGTYRDIHDFINSSAEGCYSTSTLIIVGNKFYGMTSGGTVINPYGNIFSIDTNGSGCRNLHYFNDTNGGNPTADLTYAFGKLYGMTNSGGASNHGCIFSIDTNGVGYKDIYDFAVSTGSNPYGNLTVVGNKLFGMTSWGAAGNAGCVFSIDTNGVRYKDLHYFTDTTGSGPWGSLTLVDTLLYGMTFGGGANGYGCVFSIDTAGMNYMDLYDFTLADGVNPEGSLTVGPGNFMCGMTQKGGSHNYGSAFKFTPTITNNVNEVRITANSVSIFPNPSDGNFIVSCKGIEGKDMIEIYNVLGEKVYQHNITNAANHISIPNESSGLYYYRIINLESITVASGKLVIE